MRRRRVYRGTVECTCEQCASTTELRVFDSYRVSRRWLVVSRRHDWFRTWVCPRCEFSVRVPLET